MSAGQQALVTPANSAGNSNYDPYYSNVSLLMSMNGSNSSTLFPDASQNRLTVTANGNAQISTAQNKFGGSSALFDGTGDYLTIPTNNNFGFGTGNFTVEAWISTTVKNTVIFDNRTGSPTGPFIPGVFFISSAGYIGYYDDTVLTLSGTTDVCTGNWVHLAWCRSGTVFKMFVNGNQEYSGTLSGDFGSNRPAFIGISYSLVSAYNGYIDDFRITKGVARYIANFTSPLYANPLIGPSYDTFYNNVSLLLGMNGSNGSTYFPDTSGSPKTVTANADAKVSTTQWKWGGSSAYFDGSGDYLSIGYTTSNFDWWTTDYTVEAWVYPVSLTNWSFSDGVLHPTMLGNRSPNIPTDYWSFGPLSNGKLGFYYFNGSQNPVQSTETISTGQWTHIAMSKTTSGIILFVNGIASGTTAVSGTPQSSSSVDLVVGQGNGIGINGYINDLRITKGLARYTANFTPPTQPFANTGPTVDPYYDYVSLLLPMNGANASTSFIDSSKTSKVVTANADAKVSTTQWKWGGSSAYFDGNGDYLSIPYTSEFDVAGGNFTVEAWIYITGQFSLDADSVRTGEIATFGPSTVGIGWTFAYDQTNSVLYFSANGTAANSIRGSTTISNNVWTHVAVVRSGSNNYLFVNGQSLTLTVNNYVGALTTSGLLKIGSSRIFVGFNHDFLGYIDDFRITKGVARYTANFTVPAQPNPITGVQYDNYYDNVILLLNGDGANSGTSIIDSSSYSRAPSIRNAQTVTSTTQYKYGTASIYLNATTQQLAYATTSLWNLTGFDWTIEMWFYYISTPSLLSRRDTNVSSASGWVLWAGGVRANINGVWSDTQMSWTVPAVNTWHHIAWTLNGTTMRAFLNGVLVATKSGVTQINDQGNSIFFGSATNSGENLFQGYIDNFRWTRGIARYTATFTPPTQALPSQGPTTDPFYYNTSLLLHMNSTNGSTVFTDTSPVPKNVTPAENAQISTAQSKFGGSSAYFDGTGDRLSIPTSSDFDFGSGDLTIEAWVYIAANSSPDIDGQRGASICNSWSLSVPLGWAFTIIGNTTTTGTGLAWDTWNSTGTAGTLWRATVSISQGTWHHVAATVSGGTRRLFLNGVLLSGSTITVGAGFTQATTHGSAINVGGTLATYYPAMLNGYIDDLRITKGIARYMNNFTPPQRQYPDQ